MNFIKSVFRSFFGDDCLNLSANISFCALLAIIPVGMMMISIAGFFLGGSHEAFQRIVELATNVFPIGREQFIANLQSIQEQRSSLGIVGIVFLIFIATILVSSMERALDAVFKTEKRRNFFHSRLLGVALIFWITLLFSLPTMTQILEGLLHRYGFYFPLSSIMSDRTFFFVIAFFACLMTIVIIPNQKVYIRYAAIGSLIFSAGIGVAKLIFRWYMLFAFQRYNVIYGSLTAVVLMVLWIYYLSLVFLFSAELVSELQMRKIFHRKIENGVN